MMFVHRRATGIAALLMLGMFLSATPRASAQSNGLPTEQTVDQLRRENLKATQEEQLKAIQAEGDAFALSAQEAEAFSRAFEEDIAPTLDQASQDCFFAEVPLVHAMLWARQVQLLGLADEGGALEAQYNQFFDLVHAVLANCDEQLYKQCVLDDDFLQITELAMLGRQLVLMGDEDPKYQKRIFDCSYGWRGTVTLEETMLATSRRVDPHGNASETTIKALSGIRDLKIERDNRRDNGTGSTNGRIESKQTGLYDSGPPSKTVPVQCRTTTEWDSVIESSGSGDAVWFKHGTADGAMLLSLVGPIEQGAERLSSAKSVTGTSNECGRSSTNQSQSDQSGDSWRAGITNTLDDPFAETLSGSTTLYFVMNAGGVAVAARPDSSGGLSRIPAQPGVPVDPARQLVPWLHPGSTVNVSDWQGDPPVIKVDASWNLQFGQP